MVIPQSLYDVKININSEQIKKNYLPKQKSAKTIKNMFF